ncbi:MAG: YidC/Oxa1 family membrane protein insertase [Patescibacteria group bacterium]
MQELFTTLFYQPLFNLLVWLYNVLPNHDLGLAIILLTVIVKVLLLPLSWKQVQAQAALQELQPHIERLKDEHKDDKQALAQAQMKLFAEKKINPLSSCFPLLIQLPFLFALFYVLSEGLKNGGSHAKILYPFIADPGKLNETLLGLFSLTQSHNILLAVLNAVGQFVQTKMMTPVKPAANEKKTEEKKEDIASAMNQQMLYVFPLMTGVMSYTFPSGLGLYFLVQTLVSVIQQKVFFVVMKKK